MLPGIDNPGRHSLRSFYSNIILPQFEYYYITLASPGRLYPCRWHHARDQCKVIVGATYRSVVELREIKLARPRAVGTQRTPPGRHHSATTADLIYFVY
jgi:hypothetical protein